MPAALPARRHDASFRVVHWDGRDFIFTPAQSRVVARLWEAADAGLAGVADAELLEEAESAVARLGSLFCRGGRRHPAWGAMIVQVARGVHGLAPRP